MTSVGEPQLPSEDPIGRQSDERIEIYKQAMDTFRTSTTQVVSTGGFFVVGYVTVIGFAVTNRSTLLLGASSLFMLAIFALLHRWRWFVRTTLGAAISVEPEDKGHRPLASRLNEWMGPEGTGFWSRKNWKIYAPAMVALLTIVASIWVDHNVDSWSPTGSSPPP